MRNEMITTRVRRKVIIAKVEIEAFERFRLFDIKLPANVKKITGILVTESRLPGGG
jgi:hypothetical protein